MRVYDTDGKFQVNYPAITRATSGTYSGSSAVNRAVAHGLATVPKVVLIYDTSAGNYLFRINAAYAGITYWNGTPAMGFLAETSADTTNFYVGNATSYANSANLSGQTYYWVAIK